MKAELGLLVEVVPAALDALTLVRGLPELLGVDAPRSYLLLAKNQDELRATGGFISGGGIIALDRGRIAEFSIQDLYAVGASAAAMHTYPPDPMRRYMGL